MKQHITEKQLNELSEKGKRNFIKEFHNERNPEAWSNLKLAAPLLPIGQMIEFLDEHYDWKISLETMFTDGKFCDALWEATKEVLSK